MSFRGNTGALFKLLYPDITVSLDSNGNEDWSSVSSTPQWQGVATILDTMDYKIAYGIQTTVPPIFSASADLSKVLSVIGEISPINTGDQ